MSAKRAKKPKKKRAPRPPRTPMPERPATERVRDFEEVPLGYTEELARQEAARCLGCKKPQCATGCPVEVDIPGFIALVAEGDFEAAARLLHAANRLPAICGRVCPQEDQCEKVCVLAKKAESVAVGNLERFIADWARGKGLSVHSDRAPSTGRRIAVVGSGPAGLTCAGELAARGHGVTIYEALHAPGGVLVYGIPEFRLPKAIVASEVGALRALGVRFELNAVVGKRETVDELLEEEGFDAVFIGTGAGAPRFLGVPGESLAGVYSANEYLTRSNLMAAWKENSPTPILRARRVCVVGGGNVAMDSARTALRLGAEEVVLVYRRSRAEMPARAAEIHHAEEEGIRFQLLTNPTRILGDDAGRVRGMECLRMELGEPDASGRRRPVPLPGSEHKIACDAVVVAIGNDPNPLIGRTTPGLKPGRKGTIEADKETGATSRPGVFAGGDIVTGAATVIEAMGAGRRAAEAIDAYLRG